MSTDKPLEGITVVEIGTSVAAPYAGLILADLGARVIKVENPQGGDYARTWGPPFWGDTSSTFYSLNRGKEGITIDFSNEADCASLRRLVLDHADAVIQNMRPGLLEKFGMDATAFTEKKPELIWCDIGAFGQVGPLKNKPGYDPLAQASSGIMSVTGEADRAPVRVGVSLVDMGSGMWTVIGLLAGLLERTRSGQGRRVATSLFETGLAWMTTPLAAYGASGKVGKPHGSGVAEIVPYQAFKTADAWLMIAAGNDNLFRKLCRVIGRPELSDDPDFAGNPGRVTNRARLIDMIQEKVIQLDTSALAQLLDDEGVPNSPLLTVDQVAAHPQTLALNMTTQCEGDSLPVMGIPIWFDGLRPRNRQQPPGLGQHNAQWTGAREGGKVEG
jgi:crotonobetainyl-CoA:carnitine CoA-transferase CaiB-like acyl-CoA transferase